MIAWFKDNRRFLLRFLGTLLAIGLVFLLVREGGWDEVLGALRQVSLSQIVLGLILIGISRMFVVTRWHILLHSGGVKLPFSDTTALTFTGLFATNFLPSTIGGDVVRLAGVMQMGYDRAVCLASIAADRLMGMFGMLFTLPFGLIPVLHEVRQGVVQSSIAFPAFFLRISGFIKRTLQTFSAWLGHPFALLAALGCTWGHMLCTFLTLYISVIGLGGHIDFWLIAGLWTLTYFVTLVPISINGYGVQELSLTFLLSNVAGLDPAMSLTVAILIRAFYLALSLVGAIYLPGVLATLDKDKPFKVKALEK